VAGNAWAAGFSPVDGKCHRDTAIGQTVVRVKKGAGKSEPAGAMHGAWQTPHGARQIGEKYGLGHMRAGSVGGTSG